MSDNQIISLNGVVVHVDVYVELVAVALNVSLAFGPFDSIDDGKKWASLLEGVHASKQPTIVDLNVFPEMNAAGFPKHPFVSMHMSIFIVAEHRHARRHADFLLMPEDPEKVEPLLAEYAIRAAKAATEYSCSLFDHT